MNLSMLMIEVKKKFDFDYTQKYLYFRRERVMLPNFIYH
jgi:hypothetical protein